MTEEREALKLALEALDSDNPDIQIRAAIVIRGVLAQPQQEPVACVINGKLLSYKNTPLTDECFLYEGPQPQRTWVGLTDEERDDIVLNSTSKNKAVAKTEAKLKEKNG